MRVTCLLHQTIQRLIVCPSFKCMHEVQLLPACCSCTLCSAFIEESGQYRFVNTMKFTKCAVLSNLKRHMKKSVWAHAHLLYLFRSECFKGSCFNVKIPAHSRMIFMHSC